MLTVVPHWRAWSQGQRKAEAEGEQTSARPGLLILLATVTCRVTSGAKLFVGYFTQGLGPGEGKPSQQTA